MNYLYIIEKLSDGYHFKLFPNNSRDQEIGMSDTFSTVKDCLAGLAAFQGMQTLFQENPSLYTIVSRDGKYYFNFDFDDAKHHFFRTYGYGRLSECKKGVTRVIKNMNCKIEL